MTLVLALVIGGYVALVLGLAWRAGHPEPPPDVPAALPTVAVVVAARDEEETIGRCLDALLSQEYPADRLEVIVADDHSTDRTAEIVRRRARRHALVPVGAPDDTEAEGPRVRCVRVPDPTGTLRGKANALHAGIEAAESEVVLITDADCAPVATWVRSMVRWLADPEVGVVCGLSRIRVRPGQPFDRVQALDWEFLLGSVSALAQAGAPVTGMGNNMALRSETYEAVGGYPALPFSVAEDFVLIRAVAERTAWRVRFPVDARSTVWTFPAAGPASAYDQRRRWARGGLTGGPWVVVAYALLFIAHALPIAALAVRPEAAAIALGLKIGADGVLLRTLRQRLNDRVRLGDLLAFEGFLFGYLLSLPAVLALRPRVAWKGREH